MAQVVSYFTGFETGDTSELVSVGSGVSVQNTVVRSGGYALKQSANGSQAASGLAATQFVIRFYLQVPVLPGATTPLIAPRTSAPTALMRLRFSAGNQMEVIDVSAALGLSTTTGTTVFVANQWYLVEMAVDLAGGGVVKVWVNGVLEINTTHSTNASGTPIDNFLITGVAAANQYFFDDIRVDTGGVAQIGAGQCIARQGLAGTPTYDAWTKHGGATADTCWSDTPFDTTNYCDDTSLNAFQTMLVESFAIPQTGHGTQVITSVDTINACKAAIVGKSSTTAAGAGAASIRRRVGGVDTDTSITFTTSDKYYDTGIFTDTLANLNAYEIGGGHGGVAATHTIRDAWLMVDYTLNGGPVPPVLHGTFTGIITGTLNGTFTFG